MPRRPKEENLRLRALLDEAGMSNKGLARRVVDLAAAQGWRTCGVTTRRCCGGWRVSNRARPVPELVAVVLSDALGRQVPETELGMTPSDLPGRPRPAPPTRVDGHRSHPTALWRADVQRRRFLVNAVFASAAVPASALRWLTSPPADAPAANGLRQVGRADIDAIRELTLSYREMDNRLGGGKLRAVIVSYLDDHVSRLLTGGSYREETGRQLAAACGELSQLAGWVAYDSDEHGVAQRYLTQALAYARHADDPALAQRSSPPRLTRPSTCPGQVRPSTSPEPPRPLPSVTVRRPCSPNASSWKPRPRGPQRCPRLWHGSCAQNGHLTVRPARMTRRGSPIPMRHTWRPGWRSASGTLARRATPRGMRGVHWTWTAAMCAAGPSTCHCLPPPTLRKGSLSRRATWDGRPLT